MKRDELYANYIGVRNINAVLKQQNAELLEALKDALKFIHPLSSFMGKEGTTEKKIKAAIDKAEGKT